MKKFLLVALLLVFMFGALFTACELEDIDPDSGFPEYTFINNSVCFLEFASYDTIPTKFKLTTGESQKVTLFEEGDFEYTWTSPFYSKSGTVVPDIDRMKAEIKVDFDEIERTITFSDIGAVELSDSRFDGEFTFVFSAQLNILNILNFNGTNKFTFIDGIMGNSTPSELYKVYEIQLNENNQLRFRDWNTEKPIGDWKTFAFTSEDNIISGAFFDSTNYSYTRTR